MTFEIPPFQQARILVVGDVMLDRYWHGRATRVSPEAPVPVVKVGSEEGRPGGAGNVALNLAALGSAASLVGVIGADANGQDLQSRLNAAGVYCDFLVSPSKPTITKLRVVSQHQQLIRLDFEEMYDASDLVGLQARVESLVQNAGALILSDYGKGVLGDIGALILLGRNRNIPVVVDPKGTDFEGIVMPPC